MPAIPVAPKREQLVLPDGVIGKQGIFERGDRLYMQTPVRVFKPTTEQVEEFAFSKAVKSTAPNENIVWFKGQYVEADNPNANGAQWKAQELAIKSLTPMLMPVTVMHDPRTAVGTIADVQMLTPEKDGVPRARIDTVLALWGHRFPEAVHEAEVNAQQGTLMQSMECYSPWYECSECGAVYHKLPGGAEQASWCAHLKASNPSAGYVDLGQAQSANASRILGDVCFTGTGLIFGTRGAKGAYSEAFLDSFQDEVAAYHQTVHTATAQTSPPRSEPRMGLVQIEDTELATLRKERDDAKAEAAAAKTAQQEAERQVTEAETKVTTAETAKAAAEQKVTELTETANKQSLKETRMKGLGSGFVAKLGEFTKGRLEEKAGTVSDEEWDAELKAVEEIAKVARDAKLDNEGETPEQKAAREAEEARRNGTPPTFSMEELAHSRANPGGGQPQEPSRAEQASVIGSLAGAFSPNGSSK